jgi:NAD(P)-dependent dehydrogenase (short-subunit alcohol dehydrogenase family)
VTAATSLFSVAGKRVLVTGASSGLGRATAIAMARNGATVVACGRDKTRLDATMAECPGGGHATALGDLTLDEAMDATVQTAGRVDGIVHCAGISIPTPLRLAKREFVEAVFRTNYTVPIMLTQRMLAKGGVSKGGSILFLASSAAYRGVAGVGIYAGSKGALVATTRCIALESAKHGIRINCLAPDLVETPLIEASGTLQGSGDWLEMQRKLHPLGLGKPEDVANAAIYFLSDASRWVTGTSLLMDGGIIF